jgi:hypothetical protein
MGCAGCHGFGSFRTAADIGLGELFDPSWCGDMKTPANFQMFAVPRVECYAYLFPLTRTDHDILRQRKVNGPQKLKVLGTTRIERIAKYIVGFLPQDVADPYVRILVPYRDNYIQIPESLTVDEISCICNQPEELQLKYSFTKPQETIAPPPCDDPKRRPAVVRRARKTSPPRPRTRREVSRPPASSFSFFADSWDLTPNEGSPPSMGPI